jgi:RNA polymerase sigma-70 factor (ECF subfamily)
LQAARRGDRGAYAAFIGATQAELAGFCARIAGADSEDAVQETYLALWRALPSFRGDSSARTYLYAIARRVATRVSSRRRRWDQAAAAPRGVVAVEDHGYGAVDLQEALRSLDVERRTALLLTGVLGFSYAEAAEICNCAVGTIRSRVARAREQLIAELADEPVAGPAAG